MTTATFKDVLQCIEGSHKGLLAQVISTNNGEVEMFCRDFEGTPTLFKVTADDVTAHWRPIGVARIGPRPKAFEPETATRHHEMPGDSSSPPIAAPAPSPLAPLKIDELLAPLPPEMKVVEMNAEAESPPALNWDDDVLDEEPPPTPDEVSPGKVNYFATVRNGAGDEAIVHYSLRHGVDPKRFTGIPILKARRVIPQVKPFSVTEIKEA